MAAKRMAWCLVCLGGGKSLTPWTGKRQAESVAAEHLRVYSHNVTIVSAS